jgi:hypothetical protein
MIKNNTLVSTNEGIIHVYALIHLLGFIFNQIVYLLNLSSN